MRKTTQLRQAIQSGRTLWAGPAYDGLSARIASGCNFDLLGVGGFGVSAALGLPDVGLVTMTESLAAFRACVRSSSIPVLADADAGYGNAINVIRTVQEFESIGLAGLVIEDQVSPKRCPFLGDSGVIALEEAVGKIRAAVAAKTDPDFVIRARTDAKDIDEAVVRARAYIGAGADAVFLVPQLVTSVEIARHLREAIGAPIAFAWRPGMDSQQLEALGGCMVGWSSVAILTVASALQANLQALRRDLSATSLPSPLATYEHIGQVLGLADVESAEKAFLPPRSARFS